MEGGRGVKGGSLLPREHGAYAQLGFPLLTGLLLARGHPGALAFALAAMAVFLAHEPLAVVTGVRGVRLREALGARARRRLWILGVAGAVAVVIAVVVAPPRAWLAALVPAVPGLALIPLFLTDRVKTLGGEVVAAAAFSATVMPVALSGPVDGATSWVAASVWFGAVVPAIVSVHAVKAAHKGRPPGRWLIPAAPLLAGVVSVAGVSAAMLLPYPAVKLLAVIPPALAVVAVWVTRPHPRHLKRIGWTMVAASAMTLALLLSL
jgi:hypothetical protein